MELREVCAMLEEVLESHVDRFNRRLNGLRVHLANPFMLGLQPSEVVADRDFHPVDVMLRGSIVLRLPVKRPIVDVPRNAKVFCKQNLLAFRRIQSIFNRFYHRRYLFSLRKDF